MPQDFTINEEIGIIEIKSYGELTPDGGLSSLATLQEIIKESGIKKVLTDTREQKSRPGTFNIYEFGVRLPRDAQIAIVFDVEQVTAPDISFLDNVAHNRGVIMKLFNSRREAIEWLMD